MKNTNKVFEAFNQLQSTNSVKDKELIIKQNKNNNKFLQLLKINLDSSRQYYISKLPSKDFFKNLADNTVDFNTAYDKFISLVNKLEKREITGNKAKEEFAKVFKQFDATTSSLFQKVIFKKAIGVGVSTVNKVMGDGFIPTFKVMLAPNKLPNIVNDVSLPCYIQPKLDGFRCVYHPDKGLVSRTGKVIPNKRLEAYFEALFAVKDYVLDGELYSHEVGFNEIQSLLTTEDKAIPKGLKFTVFDAMPKDQWDNKSCKAPYENRIKLVREIVYSMVATPKKVIDVVNETVESAQEIKINYKKHLNSGYEGSIIRSIDGKYLWKRATVKSGEILKLKPFKSVDVKIKDVYEGKRELGGVSGGITFAYNGVEVGCGSGFDQETLESMLKNKNDYIGKTVEIKYFEETEDGSLRFPVFVRFRKDK